MRTPARLATFLLLGLCASGCLIGSQTHTQAEGRRISQETLDRIRPGNSEEYVRALLGEPSSRTPVEQGLQIWKWQYRSVTRKEGAVFLLVASDTKTEESGAVFVEFQDGQVTRTWRD